MFEVDLYTTNGTIIPNECHSISELFKLIEDSVDSVQLINIQKIRDNL